MLSREAREANLRAANDRKSATTRAKVEAAIESLTRKGRSVNVNALHKESGVSRTYISRQDDLLALIDAAADKRATLRSAQPSPNEASLQARLKTALDANQDLLKTNTRLRTQNHQLNRRIENLTAQLLAHVVK